MPDILPEQIFLPTSDSPPHHGTSLLSVPDHELLLLISHGSYGEVWLARNALGTYRAVKVVYRKNFEHERPYEREFAGMKKFEPVSRSHEGLMDILQVGRNDQLGYFYYVIELADDVSSGQQINPDNYTPKTLASEIAPHRRLPFEQCLRLGLQLAEALSHLHEAGLVHRDIKPSNVIFVNGIPKLADIGLVADVREARSYVGTEGFIPPEGPGAVQADIYSLGKVLYEISTGKDRYDYPELPTNLDETSSGSELIELNEIILRACRADPHQRYQSAGQLHSELALLLAGKSVKRLHLVEQRLRIATKTGAIVTALALMTAAAYYQAHTSSKKANQRVVQLNVAYGVRLMDEGDLFGSLLWFAKALSLVEGNPAQEEMHRYRFDSVLRQCPKLLQVWFQDGTVNDAEFSPDGLRIVTASAGHTAQVWEVASGRPVTPPLEHDDEVSHAVFSPDGRRVVTASLDGTARIWDAASGEPITPRLKHSRPVRYAAFSRDGRFVVTASQDNTARVWNAVTGEPVCAPLRHDNWVICANLSPDGQRVITTSKDDTARIWEVATSRPVGPPLKHGAEVRHGQFSPDGRWVVTASEDNTAQVWDAATGQPLTQPLRHVSEVRYAEFSRDGRRVVTASSDNTARVWDATRGEPITPPLKHESDVWHAEFSPDGSRIVTASWDHTARVWDATTGEPVSPPLRHSERVTCASFGLDGHSVVTASADHTARVWDTIMGGPLTRPLENDNDVLHLPISPFSGARYAGFSPEGGRIITAGFDDTARVWDAGTGRPITPPLKHDSDVRHAAFSPDGSRIVTASRDGTARIWDARTGKPVALPLRHDNEVRYAVFSPDGRSVVTASWDHTARVWNSTTGEPLTPSLPHSDEVERAAFRPDGLRVVTACKDGTARVWSAATGEMLTPPLKHRAPVVNAAFSPDGRWIVTASKDHTARVWDAATGGPLTTLRHKNEVRHAAFSPDGRRVVTASYDGTARVWDAVTGEAITPALKHRNDVRYAAFSPDGRRVVTASKDRTARVWDADTGEPLAPPLKYNGYVWRAEFSPDGRRILTTSEDYTARVWYLTHDNRPAAQLSLLAQLLDGRQLDSDGDVEPLEPEAARNAWQLAKSKYPEDFAVSPEETLLWHRREAEKNETSQQWFAARFHLDCLVEAQPGDRNLRQHREAVQAKLEKDNKAP